MKVVLSALLFLIVLVITSMVAARRPKWHQLESYTFEQYVDDFGKMYQRNTPEYRMRKTIFLSKLVGIKAHNAAGKSWKQGVNMYTDMTKEEWKRFNGFRKSSARRAPAHVFGDNDVPTGWVPPIEVDYRLKTDPPVLTAVKHQGSCGCCWACSATETLEAYHALQTGLLAELSFDQVNTCTPAPASFGCDGGDYQAAWEWVNASNVPITEEWPLGFRNFFFPTNDPNANTAPCLNVSSLFPNKKPYSWFAQLTQVGVNGVVSVKPNSGKHFQAALALIGPQSISVAAGNWQNYETGVMQNDPNHGEDNEWQIDHAVQAIGYGHDKDLGMNYWIVRNSWSTNWGEAGFVKLWRASEDESEPCSPKMFGPVCGTAGILSDPQYPLTRNDKSIPF